MTQPALAAAASERPFSARLFLNRAVGFWTSRNAWLWTGGALALVFANLAVNVGINRWNKWFFDAGGERQRVAFARLLIDEPNIIIMDEATAALDIDSEFRLLTLLFDRLPNATIFSVGHRPGLQELHSRLLTLQRRPGGGRIVQTKTRDRDAWKRLKGAAVRILRRPPGKGDKDEGPVGGKAPGVGAGE